MEFFTHVNTPKRNFEISYDTPMLVIGSCFAQDIGQRLEEGLFDVVVNPAGVVYNPMSMEQTLYRFFDCNFVKKEDLIVHDGMYHSWDFHTSLSSVDPDKAVEKINKAIVEANEMIKRVKVVILTFGSTRYYKLKNEGRIVANCHKMPSQRFELIDGTIDEISAPMMRVAARFRDINKDVKVIVTVSPVRYKAYGYHESQLMKSKLLLICDKLESMFPDNVIYFPSYEIMMDELRDYRYYEPDMIHPSKLAVKYIFNRFGECFFSDQTRSLLKKAEQLTKRVGHRFIGDNEAEAAHFKAETQKLAQQLINECAPMERSITKLMK
ncbi:MAG: GSCFA domain-containing protein [Bacteroides sp.]|nr:GSCFA domain-containing protein [Bacteroides sp.]